MFFSHSPVRIHDVIFVTRAAKLKMVLKKVDNRIRVLIENGVQKKHRSLFVVVGDKGKDQVSHTAELRYSFWRNFCQKLSTQSCVFTNFAWKNDPF